MLLSYLYLNLYLVKVSIFHKYLNPKIDSYNLKYIKILRNKCNKSIHCHTTSFQKKFIPPAMVVIWFEAPPPGNAVELHTFP